MQNDYVTKNEFFKGIKELEAHFDNRFLLVEANLSRQITREVMDTFWKVVPIMFTLMTLVNGIFFIAYKMGS